jgi:hypothetical protein
LAIGEGNAELKELDSLVVLEELDKIGRRHASRSGKVSGDPYMVDRDKT